MKWVWTINTKCGQTEPDEPTFSSDVLFATWQKERGALGNVHYQGCFWLKGTKNLTNAKVALGVGHAHMEKAINWERAVQYCRKPDTRIDGPWDHGAEPVGPGQGARTDVQLAVTTLKRTRDLAETAEKHAATFVKYHAGMQRYLQLLTKPRRRPNLRIWCLYGETRTGKTTAAWDIFPNLYVLFDAKAPWMDGYNEHREVLIDDYGDGKMNIHMLKRVLDQWPMQVPVKGSSTPWNPEIIIITTNQTVNDWYPQAHPSDRAALQARMTWVNWGIPDEQLSARRDMMASRCTRDDIPQDQQPQEDLDDQPEELSPPHRPQSGQDHRHHFHQPREHAWWSQATDVEDS